MKDVRLAKYRVVKGWGTEQAFSFAATGTGSGLYVASVASQFVYGVEGTLGQLIGLGLIVVGALLTFAVHLTHPFTFARYISNFGRTWIPWGAMALLVAVICGLAALGLDKLASVPLYLTSGLFILAGACALVVTLYPGLALASTGMPFWKTSLVPLEFVTFNLVAGASIALLLSVIDGTSLELLFTLRAAMMVLLLLSMLFTLLHIGTASESIRGAARHLLLRSELSYPFIGGVMIFGLLLPLGLIVATYAVPGTGRLLVVAIVMVLVLQGSLMHRFYLLRTAIRPPLV